MDLRMWSDSYAPLDLEVRPEGYKLWKNKAQAYLLSKCPAAGKLLEWAAKQTEPITESRHQDALSLAGDLGVAQVSARLGAHQSAFWNSHAIKSGHLASTKRPSVHGPYKNTSYFDHL